MTRDELKSKLLAAGYAEVEIRDLSVKRNRIVELDEIPSSEGSAKRGVGSSPARFTLKSVAIPLAIVLCRPPNLADKKTGEPVAAAVLREAALKHTVMQVFADQLVIAEVEFPTSEIPSSEGSAPALSEAEGQRGVGFSRPVPPTKHEEPSTPATPRKK